MYKVKANKALKDSNHLGRRNTERRMLNLCQLNQSNYFADRHSNKGKIVEILTLNLSTGKKVLLQNRGCQLTKPRLSIPSIKLVID